MVLLLEFEAFATRATIAGAAVLTGQSHGRAREGGCAAAFVALLLRFVDVAELLLRFVVLLMLLVHVLLALLLLSVGGGAKNAAAADGE
eukprot:856614-Pelagomonas_calceolata.AAC.2